MAMSPHANSTDPPLVPLDWGLLAAQRILELTEELKQQAMLSLCLTKSESEIAPGKSGKRMAGQPEGMRSFGSRLNVNFGKLRISQNKPARMFKLNRVRLIEA